MNICHWNIEGLSKYDDTTDFKAYCSKYDIIGVCETWCVHGNNYENFLPSYVNFDYVRPKTRTAFRGSGGVSVFVKESLVKDGVVKRIFSYISESVILLIDGRLFHNINDIILVFAYVSPERSPIYTEDNDNGIEILSTNIDQIVAQYPEAELFLAGDLNSRIKDFPDYVFDDDIDFIFGDNVLYPNDSFNLPRKSKDNKFNRFGSLLIELCCTYGIHALNGRLFADTEGNYTCIVNNGASVVDYMLASTNLFDMFTDFGIDDKDNSIHFPIYCQLKLCYSGALNERSQNTDLIEAWSKFKWKPEFRESFINNFGRNFEQFKNNVNVSAQQSLLPFLPDFINVVRSSADEMKCKSRKNRYSVKQPPWCDKDCASAKC